LKTDPKTYKEIERLFDEYVKEVESLGEQGVLQEQTIVTYLTHSQNFVRWIRGDFEPGSKNKSKI